MNAPWVVWGLAELLRTHWTDTSEASRILQPLNATSPAPAKLPVARQPPQKIDGNFSRLTKETFSKCLWLRISAVNSVTAGRQRILTDGASKGHFFSPSLSAMTTTPRCSLIYHRPSLISLHFSFRVAESVQPPAGEDPKWVGGERSHAGRGTAQIPIQRRTSRSARWGQLAYSTLITHTSSIPTSHPEAAFTTAFLSV